jgi:hypothetical protein
MFIISKIINRSANKAIARDNNHSRLIIKGESSINTEKTLHIVFLTLAKW